MANNTVRLRKLTCLWKLRLGGLTRADCWKQTRSRTVTTASAANRWILAGAERLALKFGSVVFSILSSRLSLLWCSEVHYIRTDVLGCTTVISTLVTADCSSIVHQGIGRCTMAEILCPKCARTRRIDSDVPHNLGAIPRGGYFSFLCLRVKVFASPSADMNRAGGSCSSVLLLLQAGATHHHCHRVEYTAD